MNTFPPILVAVLGAALFCNTATAQGTINFNTRFASAGVDAPVILRGTEGPGPEFSAALFLVGAGGATTLIPSSVTKFRDGSENPILARYVEPVVAEIRGVPAGSSVTLLMRAWLTSQGTFYEGWVRGESAPFVVSNLGGEIIPPADLPASFTGFRILLEPEPSTLALAAFGGLILWCCRRHTES